MKTPAGEGCTVASSYQNLHSVAPSGVPVLMYCGLALPAKLIMFTIDDGNPSTATFRKILDKYEYRGVYFLPNYAQRSGEEIRELAESGPVCGHTVGHPDLATRGYDEQQYEIKHNEAWLKQIVGEPVICFAYPFGSYNNVTNQIVADSGYKMAFNAWGGSAVARQWMACRRDGAV